MIDIHVNKLFIYVFSCEMVLKRSKYQDIDGNVAPQSRDEPVDPDTTVPQEIEMASVSVVPDGKWVNHIEHSLLPMVSRYVYGYSSRERFRVRMVSSETVFVDWFVLDGGQHGNDYFIHSITCFTL